jgi:hypothetical protein
LKYQCKNPNHKLQVADFVKKYPSAKERMPNIIIVVDPNDWSVALEHPTLNTTVCCQVCSIAKDISQAKVKDNFVKYIETHDTLENENYVFMYDTYATD